MHQDPPFLSFDRGTIVGRLSATQSAEIPGMVWDNRVGAWRASAHKLVDLQSTVIGQTPPPGTASLDSVQWSWHPFDLRPYQQAALAAWSLNAHRGIVVLPTGSGKTRLALAAAASLRRPTLCLVPTRVLLGQWIAELRRVYDGPIGVFGDGERTLAELTVATFASAWRHMAEIGERFDTLIIDEAHHFGNAVQDEALEMCAARHRLGLTATPPSEGGTLTRLTELVGPVVFQRKIADLAGTFLAPFETYSWFLPLTASERQTYERAMLSFHQFSRTVRAQIPNAVWADLVRVAGQSPAGQAAMAGYRRARATVALTKAKGRALVGLLRRHASSRILVFTADTATAYRLSRFLFVPALTADIKRKERDEIIKAFRTGDLPIIVSCRVLNEGVDVPDADVAIILGGTNGGREHVQRVGRVLRPAAGKVAVVYELIAADTFEVRQSRRRREAVGEVARTD